MRKYQEIWERLKKRADHTVTIEVHPAMFPRVIKAVIKEKNQDLGFKVINDLEKCYLEIARDTVKKRITFKLRQRFGLQEMRA